MSPGRDPDGGEHPGAERTAWGEGPSPGTLVRRLRYLAAEAPRPRRPESRRQRRLESLALANWDQVGDLTWRRRLQVDNPLEGTSISELLLPEGYAPEEVLFFDTETTGLSGGAGSYVFLFGAAWLEGARLSCEQLFLADFPGEPEFLKLLAERLAPHRLFVSYNGRAFDAPLLRGRFVMNRMSFHLERHEDLLHWARRLWRRHLPDCALGTVEREILGVERAQDVAGWEVPLIYLRYLATGEEAGLPAVMEHNLQDVVSLARLCGRVNLLLRQEALPGSTDGVALGSYLLRAGHDRGEAVLTESFREGDHRAGLVLSLHYKRIGKWSEAVALWETMARAESLFAAIELSKYHEHRAKDPQVALEWVHRVVSWELPLSPDQRRDLDRRRARLDRKCHAWGGRAAGVEAPGRTGPGGGDSDGDSPRARRPGGDSTSDGAPGGFSRRVRAFRELNRRRSLRSVPISGVPDAAADPGVPGPSPSPSESDPSANPGAAGPPGTGSPPVREGGAGTPIPPPTDRSS